MKVIDTIIKGLFQSRPVQDDEYINGTDKLIYCTKCHTPRQCRIAHEGQVFTPSVSCHCQREAYEKAEAEFQHRQKLMRIERLKSNGLQDRYLRDYNFDNDKGYNPEETKKAHRYVDQWAKMEKDCTGLLLWGDVGTGKTFIAGCIANALIEKGIPVLMTNFSRILNTLSGMFNEDRNTFIESFNQYTLLIIDDLGIERDSKYGLEQVFNVIDSRYRCQKPLIITTNLTLVEMKNADLDHTRIYDRILEMCTPMRINNQNIRKINAETKLNEARKLLSDKLENIQ